MPAQLTTNNSSSNKKPKQPGQGRQGDDTATATIAPTGLAIARASLSIGGAGGALSTVGQYPMAPTDPAQDQAAVAGLPPRVNGAPTEQELERINQLSRSGKLTADQVYCFDAAISTGRIDSYLTQMDITTLRNYVMGAARGVPVQYSHATRQLPLGRSYYGELSDDPLLPGMSRAIASAFMLRNNQANGLVNTDEVIASIEAGITADVSVGFGFFPGTPEQNFEDRTWYRCSVCGADWLAAPWWSDDPDDCHHWPGDLYKFEGGSTQQMCYLQVVNGILSEFSPVYAGATDGAVITKAQRAAEAGALTRSQVYHLEERYRTRLLGDRSMYAALPLLIEKKPSPTPTTDRVQSEIETKETRKKEGLAEMSTASTTATITNDDPPQTSVPVHEQQSRANGDTAAAVQEAYQQGQRVALTNLLNRWIGSVGRALDENEQKLVQDAIAYIASDDMENAQATLATLSAGLEPDGDEGIEGEGDEDEDNQNAATTDDGANFPGDTMALVDDEVAQAAADALAPQVSNNPDLEGTGDQSPENRALVPLTTAPTAVEIQAQRELLQQIGLSVTERQQLALVTKERDQLRRELRNQTRMAEIGQRYCDAVIEETVAAAIGCGITTVTESFLRQLPIETVEQMRDQYSQMRAIRLGTFVPGEPDAISTMQGGRQTQSLDPNAAFINGGGVVVAGGGANARTPTAPARPVEVDAYRG